jgi:hypothetical protein
MASAKDVAIVNTDSGVRVTLGKIYLYPDGHANLTFPANHEQGQPELNMPLTNVADLLVELTSLVALMATQVKKHPGKTS